MAYIEIKNLSKWYGQVLGISGVTARIEPGVTGLLGPNGAGKSTLLKILTGQIKADTGRERRLAGFPSGIILNYMKSSVFALIWKNSTNV